MEQQPTMYRRLKDVAKVALGRKLGIPPRLQRHWEFHGTSYGGFAIVPDGLGPGSIIYSVGIGTDISFDLSLISRFGVDVFAFDPTPRSLEWLKTQTLPDALHYYPYGLASTDGTMEFFPPEDETHVSFSQVRSSSRGPVACEVRTLPSLMRMLGHSRIDVLKMDIEGAEYEVLPDILASGMDIKQILVEFHFRFLAGGARKTRKLIRRMETSGYQLFAVSDREEEYSFLRV